MEKYHKDDKAKNIITIEKEIMNLREKLRKFSI